MAITSSAKKAWRSSLRKREFNLVRLDKFREVTKQIKKLVAEKKTKAARELLPQAYKALDKAAKMNTIKKNAASRKKSRLSAFIKKATV